MSDEKESNRIQKSMTADVESGEIKRLDEAVEMPEGAEKISPPLMAAGMLHAMARLVETQPDKVRIFLQMQWRVVDKILMEYFLEMKKTMTEETTDRDEEFATAFIFLSTYFKETGAMTRKNFTGARQRLIGAAPGIESGNVRKNTDILVDTLGRGIEEVLMGEEYDQYTKLSLQAGAMAHKIDDIKH